ncbi:EAL domain-containing protein [Herbaspirillum sp. SJZ107]|uniref:EAL domain-containing protein n=1 Tax=Herbaspirillum sp. SJZ107 TaxID=2572881 RepID=UPI0011538EA8|nr:EAL domain-containing protein [Herbaspirillum sp. SJZ107]TQK03331.1 PAS domain S-box-containing protein/diguanylate cyclase (GGDEF)-like protein [Herbaspirillum sp. SJZ107]
MTRLPHLLPRSLMGRIFAVFSLTMLVFLAGGLALFYRYQFLQHIEETQDSAMTLVEVAAQTIEDSAVIGDYDTVRRTLSKMLVQSPFKSAEFLDVAGGRIRLEAPPLPPSQAAPDWMRGLVAEKLYDVNRVANVGGKDYGVVRLSFDERKLAAQMWAMVAETSALALIVFAVSLALMRTLLRRWLDNLGRLRSFENDVAAGRITAAAALHADAPSEIQEAIQAVNRSADSLRAQFGQRIDALMNSLMQHKSAMDQAAIVCEVDTGGRIAEVNELFVANSGFTRAELVGMPLGAVGRPADPDHAWQPGPQVWNGEVALAGRNGVRQWRRTIVPMFEGERIERYICIDIDITERKEFERAIVENAKRQTLIAELGRKALADNDLDELFAEAAEAAARGLGTPGAALFEAAGDGSVLLRAAAGRLAGAEGQHLAAAALLPQPHDLPLRPWMAPLAEQHGLERGLDACIGSAENPFGLIGVYDDGLRHFGPDDATFLRGIGNILATAIERRDARNRLTYLAQYDPLTSLPNRRHLALGLEQALARASAQGRRAAVMFIDLDRFKNVNDMLGHGVGDQLLVQAAARLQACAREGELVARLGGDEFAVVLPDVSGDDDTAALAAEIIQSLAQPFYLQGQQLFVSASVGIASYPEHGDNAEILLKSADTAMYGAKNDGRNTYQFFARAMHENAALRLQTEAQLRQALERGEFLLHYQPKLDLAGATVSGFEALLRWNHPQRGLVPPLEFISILEDTGLILPVGEWVIGEVCRQLKAWQADGLPLAPVAINLSARQLQQDDLAGAIERIVVGAGVEPTLLEFELTESMLMTNPEAAVETLSRIKALGMRLSVDDFGTGYSSLAYLKRFPLDALKIDRTFVRDLPHDSDDALITKAVIRLAHSLNLKVVAEGVENVEQIRELEKYDCDEIQGYYVSRPLPAQGAAAMLVDKQVAPV